MLERRLIVDQRKKDSRAHQAGLAAGRNDGISAAAGADDDADAVAADDDAPLTGYEDMELPPLPPRFQHLAPSLPRNWYVPGRAESVHKKRKHTATHGGKALHYLI